MANVISSGVQRRVSTEFRTGATVNALQTLSKAQMTQQQGRTRRTDEGSHITEQPLEVSMIETDRISKCDFRPFRATFSMKNVWSVLFRKRSISTFGSVGYFLRFQHKNKVFNTTTPNLLDTPKNAKICTVSRPECQLASFSLKT